jgi:hypothetical protein
MENLFRAADYAAKYNLSKKRLRITNEEWAELHRRLVLSTVIYFLSRLRRCLYDRSVPFFVNVLGAARASSYTVKKYLNEIREKLNMTSTDTPEGDEMGTFGDFLPDKGIHPLFHRVASHAKYVKEIKAKETPESALNRLWAEEDERLVATGSYVDWQTINFHRQEVLARVSAIRRRNSGPDKQEDGTLPGEGDRP